MKKLVVLISIVLAIILTACGVAQKASTQYYGGVAPVTAAPATQAPAAENYGLRAPGATDSQGLAPAPSVKSLDAGSGGSVAEAQQRLIQTNVSLSLIVTDPQKKMDEINQMAVTLGGYLVSQNMSQVYTNSGTKVPQGEISIRVPSEKLDTALNTIEADIIDVTSENRTGQDVTSQYVDLQSQLKNLQQAEQDLLDIMDEAKNAPGNDSTTKTQDVLNVYNQIVSIRGQIEQIQGQLKYITETTSTSGIDVTLVAEETVQPIKVAHWEPKGTANVAIQGLIKFLQGFADFLITFSIKVLPELILILGPIALIIWAIIAGIKRGRAKKVKAV